MQTKSQKRAGQRRSTTPAPEPLHIAPMLATPSERLPQGPGYAYEFKWDGYRAILHCDHGRVRIDSRRLNDVTEKFPQVAASAALLRTRRAVVDGEIVALDPQNRPSFSLLQQHLRVRGSGPRPTTPAPVVFFAFDLLHLDDRSLLGEPYVERRERLRLLTEETQGWNTPPFEVDQGPAMLAVSENLRLEGIVAKRLDSVYEPGVRSPNWLKIKHRTRQEFVVGGWSKGEGGRTGTFGSLLLGYYDRTPAEAAEAGTRPKLVYAGRVGTGFDDETLRELRTEFDRLGSKRNPFEQGDPGPDVHFLRPVLVAEVSYTEWTHLGTLRQTSFHGLRRDKEATDVTRDPIVKNHGE